MRKQTHTADDTLFMRECLRLAKKGAGVVSPNPLVGAVLVRKNKIVSRGYHRYFGGPHAEVECLRRLKGETSGTTLYTNLEPCTHYGKTPPCADLIIQRGIERVVVGMKDPNPLVAGKGITRLRRAGVKVVVGVLEDQATSLNKSFIKHMTTKTPYVHIKIAQTEDGFIAKGTGPLRYITSLQSRKMVHRWRAEYDAVLVGAGTMRADNPELDVRLANGRDPAVIILDGQFRISGKEKVFASARRRRMFLCTKHLTRIHNQKKNLLLKQGIHILEFPMTKGRFSLRKVLKELYRNSICSVLVEGGSDVFTQFRTQNLIDELSVFTAPHRFGSGVRAFGDGVTLDPIIERGNFVSSRVGTDVLMTGRIH